MELWKRPYLKQARLVLVRRRASSSWAGIRMQVDKEVLQLQLQWLNLQRCQQVTEVGGAGPGAWPAPQGPVDEVAGMAISGVAAGL